MSRQTRTVVHRGLAVLGLLVGGASAPACRDLVAGDNVHALDALCERVEACSSDQTAAACSTDLEARFDKANPTLQASALAKLGSECLDGHCGVVAGCLDDAPFCVEQRATCARDGDCCDSTLGYLACTGGECCAKRGRPCEQTEDCCAPERCSEVNDGANVVLRCGGVICREVGSECDTGGDCCTGACVDQLCVSECVVLGSVCDDDDACCREDGREVECVPQLVSPGELPRSFCTAMPPPECAPSGAECTEEGGCCDSREVCDSSGNALECCLPAKSDCAQDYECCSGECALVGAQFECTQNPCVAEDGMCDEPTDCCSGYCDPVGQICADPSCQQDCDSSPCEVGGGKGGCTDPPQQQAVTDVLTEDVVCACDWDAFCVDAFDAKTMGEVCNL